MSCVHDCFLVHLALHGMIYNEQDSSDTSPASLSADAEMAGDPADNAAADRLVWVTPSSDGWCSIRDSTEPALEECSNTLPKSADDNRASAAISG